MTGDVNHNIVSKTKPFDLVETVSRHWLKIVIFGSVLFLLLLPAAFLLKKPYYKTEGKVRVSPVIPSMIAQTEETTLSGDYAQYIKTQVERIKGRKTIEKAINKLPPELKISFFQNNIPLETAATAIQKRLVVSEVTGTYLISIEISSDNPKGLTELLNNIMDVFIEEHQNEEEGKDSRRLTYLTKEKDRLETEIAKQEKHLQDISNEITSSDLIVTNDMTAQFQSLYETAYKQKVEKESVLKAVIKETEAMKRTSIDSDVDTIVENNSLLSKIDVLTQDSIHELRNTMEGMSHNNPERKQINSKISEIENYSLEKRNAITDKAKDIVSRKLEADLEKQIIKAKAEFEAAKMTEEGLLMEKNRLHADLVRITPKIIDKKQIEDSLALMRTFLNKIYDRIQELQLESKSTGRLFIETRPAIPHGPSGNNLIKLIMLMLVFSFGSVTIVCVIFDLLDDRVRSVKDVVSVLGAIPHRPIPDYLASGNGAVSFSKATLEDPSSEVSLAIHSLAIRLDKERKENGARITAFTGVDAKSGVTEILINAAHAMSKLCSKVLVIEGNFSNPKLSELYSCKNGLVDIMLNKSEPLKSIVHDKERGIDIICAGHHPDNHEMVKLDRSKIPSMLDALKKEYDFILIDTIPMLISDLTELLLINSDISTLVIQGDRTSYKHLHLANQALTKLGVPAIATVLNWGAPRYRTGVQKFVFKYLWPINERIRYSISRCIHPIPMRPYHKTEVI
jgi:polysaccharide biosynthesis transport protein